MATYNLNQSWDLTSPPSLPSLPDDDFLALLQKQFVANNPTTIDFAPFGTTKSLQQVPNSANPQSLSHLPITNNNTPPLTDSSPSPPSADNTSGVERANRRNSGGVTNHWLDGGNRNDEDALKRKASTDESDDEDDDGQPSHKSQHLDRVNSSISPQQILLRSP
jgi:AP-1-like factor